jgi:hypothetical protein
MCGSLLAPLTHVPACIRASSAHAAINPAIKVGRMIGLIRGRRTRKEGKMERRTLRRVRIVLTQRKMVRRLD